MSTRKIDSPGKWLADEVDRIRARRDLSDEGKLAHIGRVYRDAKDTSDRQRQAAGDDWQARHDSLIRPLMAPTTHTAEWRQLREEALKISKPEDAMRRLETALATGDTLEAQAYGAAALDRAMSDMPGSEAWVNVVNRWGQSSRHIDDALTALSKHRGSRPSATERLLEASTVSKPRELHQNPHWEQLLDIADSDDRADLTPEAKRTADNLDVTFSN